jgi:multisubunit Na+/H+ antiporter MnhG subunit
MTAAAPAAPLLRLARWQLPGLRRGWTYPTLVAAAGAVAFVAVSPAVGDLWAALARQSAVANGVGLTYWFGWFGGGSTPGSYSVLTPFLSAAVGASVVGAVSTAAIPSLCWLLVRGSRHARAATWVATVVTGLSLWSGRIPFALGTALSISAFLAVRSRRRAWAGVAGLLTVLASPVSGAFVVLGVIGILLSANRYRAAALWATAGSGIALLGLAIAFGPPGPEPFTAPNAAAAMVALVVFLIARPQQYVRTAIYVALVACPLLLLIPNGMGSNFERFVWVYLPVAVVATADRRLPLAALAISVAVWAGAQGTAQDLYVAGQPNSSAGYYQALSAELDHIPQMQDYRLEVVPDGTHASAYALLGHAMLARGYETQEDYAVNAVLLSTDSLNEVSYKVWLDNNAVGYVAFPTHAVRQGPEYRLVAHGLSYLTVVWSNPQWSLYRVEHPVPVVGAPARVVSAQQSRLVVSVPHPGTYPVRVRWSKFLTADGPTQSAESLVVRDGQGWTLLRAPVSGNYILHG